MKRNLKLITKDNDSILYTIDEFSRISKVFDDHITSYSFDQINNMSLDDDIVEYKLDTDHKIISWILNNYYIGKYFNDINDLISWRKMEINKLEENKLICIYNHAYDMQMYQLLIDIIKYMKSDNIIKYFMPSLITNHDYENIQSTYMTLCNNVRFDRELIDDIYYRICKRYDCIYNRNNNDIDYDDYLNYDQKDFDHFMIMKSIWKNSRNNKMSISN